MKVSWDDYPIYTVHIFSPPPLRPTSVILFSYYIDCFIARSTICILLSAKKTHNALESLLPFPHPKVDLPKLCFFFFVLVFLSWYPSPSQTQPKTNHPKPKINPKKHCIGEPSPLPHPKVGLPIFCVFLFLVPLPFRNPTQNKSSNMCVCLFFLVWGRGAELLI